RDSHPGKAARPRHRRGTRDRCQRQDNPGYNVSASHWRRTWSTIHPPGPGGARFTPPRAADGWGSAEVRHKGPARVPPRATFTGALRLNSRRRQAALGVFTALLATPAAAQQRHDSVVVLGLRAPNGDDEAAANATEALRGAARDAGFEVPNNSP